MSIETQTKDIMTKAIKRYSEEEGVDNSKIQLLIYTDNPDCLPKYKVLKNNRPLKEVSFNEILDVKMDFLGREIIATPFIASSLKRLVRETKCSYEEANVLIYTQDDTASNILLYFFVNQSPAKPIGLKDLLGQTAD